MAFDNVISRADASALIPEDVASDIIRGATQESFVLSQFRRVPMSRGQQRMPVLSALPTAYFVTGDTGLKQTTELAWANKYLDAEELAVIVPVPQAVLDDADFDIWGESKPRIVEAIGRAIDGAVAFGINAPSSWPQNMVAAAIAAGNDPTEGAAATAGGFQDDVDQLMGAVEADGFDVTAFAASRTAKSKFRRARDANGQRLEGLNDTLTEYLGVPISYTMSGLWPDAGSSPARRRMIAFDKSQFVVGVRRDIEYKISEDAVIQDNTGAIIYNLFQQDMVAMRVTMRVAWQVANIINYDEETEADRYPAAVLRY